jgi:DNA invertase Pin-like site-specific DNA recombinase
MCCVSAATVSARREGLRGRPPSIEASRVREMKAQGMRPSDIAKALKIDRASV